MFFRKKRKATSESNPSAGSTPAASNEPPQTPAPAAPPSTQFLTGEANQDSRTVQVLLDAIAKLSETADLDALLVDIVDKSVEITGAERGLLLLAEEGKEGLETRVARERGGKTITEDLRFSTSIASKVLDEVQALRATVHSESEALELGRSVYDLKLRAVMCVPLAAEHSEKKPSGVLYVDSRAATRQFSQGDLSLFAALAHHISITLEKARLNLDRVEKVRLEQSLELASEIQRNLMPRVPKDLPGWDLFGWYGPAESAAGDFYDFVKARNGKLAIVVGDVTGHGIGPALITSRAQGVLSSFLRTLDDPGDVVTFLNEDLCERVEDGRFLTLFMAMLDGEGKVDGLNGGHALPFLWRAASGEIETIAKGGPALGMIPGEQYVAHEPMVLGSGDVLLIYTDGLTEARDPVDHDRLFGEDGVKQVLSECAAADYDAKDICLKLVEVAMEITGGLREDDITVVVARRK